MTIFNKKVLWLLPLGDIAIFVISLWLTLILRSFSAPSFDFFLAHLAPFSLLFGVWVLVFFIVGLYDKQSIIFKSRLPILLTQSQITNMVIATTFFYFIPWFGISPKTTLFLYLLISLALILLWRVYGYFMLVPRSKEIALVVGSGEDIDQLKEEVNSRNGYNLVFKDVVDPQQMKEVGSIAAVADTVKKEHISVIAVDLHNEHLSVALPGLYNLIFSKIRFLDTSRIYEDIFDRVPLSLIKHSWFLENVSTAPKFVYDGLKRLMDICASLMLGFISLIFYPFVALAIKIEDKGPIFFSQERVGKNNKIIRIVKFRSMSVSSPQYVTKVGTFIRKTHIDELPQLMSVFRGDLSLIGPRPESPDLAAIYEEEIPFYNVRHLIKPGLSGWAQLLQKAPPKFSVASDETRIKLSYDLYYIKNRSFLLDLVIALKTIKQLLGGKGI